MNTYDFDETILFGDSEIYFIKYVILKYPQARKEVFWLKLNSWLYKHKMMKGPKMWTLRYRHILKYVNNLDEFLEEFWDEHFKFIKKYYLDQQREDDVIISATPDFILNPVMKRLGIKHLIATKFDVENCKVIGEVDKGEEKVNRFYKEYPNVIPDTFYSDSDSDLPMAKIAKKAYKVKDYEITEWKF